MYEVSLDAFRLISLHVSFCVIAKVFLGEMLFQKTEQN